jgi:hypothetical protein
MAHDELEVRRWFRRRLEAIGNAHPELKEPGRQDACAQWLETDDKEYADDESSDTDTAKGEYEGQAERHRSI